MVETIQDTSVPTVPQEVKDVIPVPCKNNKCCGKYLFYAVKDDQKVLMPLTKVDIKVEIRGALATTKVQLCYINPSKESSQECTYTFPLDKTSVLADFDAKIDDRVIQTKVKDKEEAKEDYEDAVAGGNAAVIAERSKKKEEVMTIKLGNLLPGQTASLKSTIISQVEIVAGSYCHSLPVAFFPDYKKHGVKDKDTFAYEFTYEARIQSNTKICNLGIPRDAEIVDQNEGKTDITVRSGKASRSMDLYYRTADMMVPLLQYAKNAESDQYAVSISLVPTFDPIQP